MVIVHIAKMYNDLYRGVSYVVPSHIINQMKFAEVILANIDNNEDYIISNVKQIHINPRINFFKLPNPFNYPDLIVFHEVYYWQYIFISAQLRKLKIPYIIIPHGSLTDNAQKYKLLKKKIGNNFFFNKFINGAKAIQYLSKNELENSNFGKMKFVGSNGVEIPHNYKINFNVDKIIITFIGRLNIYYKGLDLLLNGISKIKNIVKENNIIFNIYGPTENNSKNNLIELIKKYELNDFIFIYNPVNGKEKEIKLINSDIFIQTSRSEGMPMGILEAMSYGLPCLVTRGTSLGELIEKYDAGWVCETNSESIANCIMRCIQEKELFKIKGQNVRRLIKENFTWEKVARETIDKYKELIDYEGE